MELHLKDDSIVNGAFALAIPHLNRVKSLIVNASALVRLLEHFRCHSPLLEELDFQTPCSDNKVVLDGSFFNGDLSSLPHLRLNGLIMDLPWTMANLRDIDLQHDNHVYGTTQILDFFESAPLLYTAFLHYPMPDPSDAPAGRIVYLHHLKAPDIGTISSHSTILRHLRIPIGASLTLKFRFRGGGPLFLEYLPESPSDFSNLSHITTIKFAPGFESLGDVKLFGSSGSLCVFFKGRPGI